MMMLAHTLLLSSSNMTCASAAACAPSRIFSNSSMKRLSAATRSSSGTLLDGPVAIEAHAAASERRAGCCVKSAKSDKYEYVCD